MILIVDGLNRHRYSNLIDEMFALRARVFKDRLGWDVVVEDGKEIDEFDSLDPAYVLGLDDDGHVVACVRALQTTGPHMLSDVFSDILDGEPPLRSPTLWESTRFCVDTDRLSGGKSRNSVSYATCELMAGSLEFARDSGHHRHRHRDRPDHEPGAETLRLRALRLCRFDQAHGQDIRHGGAAGLHRRAHQPHPRLCRDRG